MINTIYSNMKLSQFDYKLPKELIAERPIRWTDRDETRLMVLHRDTGVIEHKQFKDLLSYVQKDDVMVVNNTCIFPALLKGEKEKTGAEITVFLVRELNPETYLWDVVVEPARKIRIGNKLYFGDDASLVAEVVDNTTSRGRTIRFLFDEGHDAFMKKIRSMGTPSLPREEKMDELMEIRRISKAEEIKDHAVCFGTHEGSCITPSAGLHFSKIMLKKLEILDVKVAEVTLHAGMGNFKEIEVEDLSKHRMDSEEMNVSEETCNIINKARQDGHKICCVGTTAMKALESAVTIPGKLSPYKGWSNKFIFPPYDFSIADMMITNFHEPCTSMLIMASAFAGADLLMQAYQVAIKEKYKFSLYGDAMLIL